MDENGNIKVDVRFEVESIWLSQTQLAEVFGKAKSTISEHISAIFEEVEIETSSTVRSYRTVQKESKRKYERDQDIYYKKIENYLIDIDLMTKDREVNHYEI